MDTGADSELSAAAYRAELEQLLISSIITKRTVSRVFRHIRLPDSAAYFNTMKSVHLVLCLLVIERMASLTWAKVPPQKPCSDPCGQPTAWQDFNSFALRVTTPSTPAYSEWKGGIDEETRDTHVDVEQSDGTAVVKGRILIIGGRVRAMHGPIARPGCEIDCWMLSPLTSNW